jgi:hypothetical protein
MQHKLKFYVMACSYNENVGGTVVLHKLCHELNKLGFEAHMIPIRRSFDIKLNNLIIPLLKLLKDFIVRSFPYKTNSKFRTPVCRKKINFFDKHIVVIYPENISGNPLNAKNIIRWFLHHPGYHEGEYSYGFNELYFRYHSGIKVPSDLEISTSSLELKIVHYPTEFYNKEDQLPNRVGTAYSIRKGAGKRLVHDLTNSILIDGRTHKEISEIFKRVKIFISYDTRSAYSTFAVLCGCNSVIVPDEGEDINEWMPNLRDRAGLAYGFEMLDAAALEHDKLEARVYQEIASNKVVVENFIAIVNEKFA